MRHVVSDFFAGLGMPFTAKSLRAFVVTNWRKARVPDDVLRGRVGHDDATPVTDRHYHYRDEVADRQETDQLVGPLLYAAPDRGPDPSDRKSTRLNSSHPSISYAVFCLKKKKKNQQRGLRSLDKPHN